MYGGSGMTPTRSISVRSPSNWRTIGSLPKTLARGAREDRSGPAVREILGGAGFDVDAVMVVADDVDAIAGAIENATADGARLVVTTGGTGIAPRDVTPEATAKVCDRVIPGFGELMRKTSSPMAPLSRAQAATRGA